MKGSKTIIVAIVVVILGFLIVYSQTGIPEGAKKPHAAAGGYGGGDAKLTPMLPFINMPGDEGVIPQGANPQLLVTTADIEKNKNNWIVLDCRDKASYDEGHIPGAISLGGRCHVLIRDTEKVIKVVGKMKQDYDFEPIREALEEGKLDNKTLFASLALRPVEQIEKIFAQAGITNDKTVVIYSDAKDIAPGYHAVPFFTLEYFGHPDVRILDGGIEGWVAEGKQLEQKANKLSLSNFKAKLRKDMLATTEDVLKIAKGEIKDAQIVDSRLVDESIGKAVAPPGHFLEKAAGKKGMIPNTVLNVPHFYQFTDMKTLKMRPIWQLERLYGSLDKDKKTVLYCYIANRISFSYFVLRMLGFKNPAIYHDSYIIWGNDPNLPVLGPDAK